MKETPLWIVIVIVIGFLGFMMGYAVPPFMEVGFGHGGQEVGQEAPADKELMKQYQELYKDDSSSESGQ